MFLIAISAAILLCVSDIELGWKALALVLCLGSMFLPDGAWMVALPMQLGLVIWGLAYWDGPPLKSS